MIDPILIGRADTLVRAGSPDPAAPASYSNRERRERVCSSSGLKTPEGKARSSQNAVTPDPGVPERGVCEGRERVTSPIHSKAPERGVRKRRERVRSSSGPKTDAGKARSSQNAVTHGLRATKLDNAVAPELRAAYEQLRQQYLDEYKATGAIESTLLDMVIFAAWQLYKIREMELFTDIDLGAPGSFGRSEKLARYRGSHERLLFRSLNQLRQIQQERALLATDKSAALPAHIPPGVKLKPLLNHLKSLARHPKTLSASATTPKSANRERRERVSSPHLRLKLRQN
ncbi:MAG TPA: hypothetical protein PKJ41_01325 [Bryobacteraceae bacterium]|nr:hypothetical protein [Bryobacteraceae bacterium]